MYVRVMNGNSYVLCCTYVYIIVCVCVCVCEFVCLCYSYMRFCVLYPLIDCDSF